MKKNKKISSWIIIILAIIAFIFVYSKYNFNNFEKSIKNSKMTDFTRDSNIKYSKAASYKVENKDYNDAMFSQTISVLPNTPYKITCMVKTENVESINQNAFSGAYICVKGSGEKSNIINGTSDWQEISLMFNSKNRQEIEIGFRLGSYDEEIKGTAWFSDFKVEMGSMPNNNEWNMVCFIFPNIDVNVETNGTMQNVKLQMSDNDIFNINTNLERFKSSIREISNEKIKINYDIITINESIKTLSYDETNGYFVADKDVYEYINPYIEKNEYDHIFIAIRMADKQKGSSTLISDWIGLGGMDYKGIGFSNIRMPDDENNIVYEYNNKVNTFPEEVYLHEFLHTLERNCQECDLDRPELHDYAKYGYTEDKVDGLRKWYADYMNKEIMYNGEKIGLPVEIYKYKPAHKSNFKYALSTDALHEPSNIIEIITSLFSRVGKVFKYNEISK